MKVRRGDRVRLVADIAKRMMDKKDKRRVNWLTRRGVVIRVSMVSNSATIKWDDRATVDFWPVRALEKAS